MINCCTQHTTLLREADAVVKQVEQALETIPFLHLSPVRVNNVNFGTSIMNLNASMLFSTKEVLIQNLIPAFPSNAQLANVNSSICVTGRTFVLDDEKASPSNKETAIETVDVGSANVIDRDLSKDKDTALEDIDVDIANVAAVDELKEKETSLDNIIANSANVVIRDESKNMDLEATDYDWYFNDYILSGKTLDPYAAKASSDSASVGVEKHFPDNVTDGDKKQSAPQSYDFADVNVANAESVEEVDATQKSTTKRVKGRPKKTIATKEPKKKKTPKKRAPKPTTQRGTQKKQAAKSTVKSGTVISSTNNDNSVATQQEATELLNEVAPQQESVDEVSGVIGTLSNEGETSLIEPSKEKNQRRNVSACVPRKNKILQCPAALRTQENWKVIHDWISNECSFEEQDTVINDFFANRCRSFIVGVRNKLGLKLQLHSLEATKVNIFCILMTHAFEAIMEYTNEAMVSKRLVPTTPGEFRCFLGTLLLSSAFNLSPPTAWNLMHSLTNGNVMPRERYVQILNNLQGYELSKQIITDPSTTWCDQRNTLDNLHPLEEKNL
jgi:hypothetical protein